MMIAILSAFGFFELFVFVLGITHAFDADDQSVAAPVTMWWILFAAAVPVMTMSLLTWGTFIFGAAENIMYGTKQVFGLPFDFLSIVLIASMMLSWAVYHLGYLIGTAIAARCQPLTIVRLPITVPLPTVTVISKPKLKLKKMKTVEEMLGISVKEDGR